MLAVGIGMIMPVVVMVIALRLVASIGIAMATHAIAEIPRENVDGAGLVLAQLQRSPSRNGQEKGKQSCEDEFHFGRGLRSRWMGVKLLRGARVVRVIRFKLDSAVGDP